MGTVQVIYKCSTEERDAYIREQLASALSTPVPPVAEMDALLDEYMQDIRWALDGGFEAEVAKDMASEITTSGDIVIAQKQVIKSPSLKRAGG